MLKKTCFLFISVLFFSIIVSAEVDSLPNRPVPARLVNNLSSQAPGFLSSSEEGQLERKLDDFANQTSNQITVVITDDLKGLEPWDYATQLGRKWGIGQGKFNNGIVILIKPTDEGEKHTLFIAVGTGLEGAIPDITTKQIRENEMNPYFRNKQYFTGLDKGTDVIMALAKGDYNSDAYAKKYSTNRPAMGIIIPLVFFILIIVFRFTRGGGRGGMTMGGGGIFFGSGFGGGGGFSGGSSGSSSGGFGGFGGGSFGGGGSGGSW